MSLSTEEIRTEISQWMGQLFDNNKVPEDVRAHVEDLTKKILSTQLKGQNITKDKLQQLFKNVENAFNKGCNHE